MDNTLRRHMFKVGGEVNTHGVGITSGLEYRRPGYNAGGPVVKPGPDGKLRQHAFAGGLMNLLLAGAPKLASRFGSLLTGKLPNILRYGDDASKFVAKKADTTKALKLLEALKKPLLTAETKVPTAHAKKIAALKKILASRGGIETAAKINRAGFLKQAGRAMWPLAGPAAVGGGAYSAMNPDALPETKGGDITRMLTEGTLDFGSLPGLGFMAKEYLETPRGEDYKYRTLSDYLKNETPIDTSENNQIISEDQGAGDSTSTVMDTLLTQEEQFEKLIMDSKMREKMYYDALKEEPNRAAALQKGLANAAALWDTDRPAALAGLGSGITEELQPDAELKSEVKKLALADVLGEEDLEKSQAQKIKDAKLAIVTDPAISSADKAKNLAYIDGYQQGIKEVLPTNIKGDAVENAKQGTAYIDVTGLTGKNFAAVSKNGTEVIGFNSAQEALAHAAS